MVKEVEDPETLLRLQAPFLILWRMHDSCWSREARGDKLRIRCPDLSERLTRGKAFQKSSIEGGGILRQAIRLTGCQIVASDIESADVRGIVSKVPKAIGKWVVKNPNATA